MVCRLCIYCIRKRRQTGVGVVIPLARTPKKPALRRAEARERLNNVTDVSNVTSVPSDGAVDLTEQTPSSASFLEREWYAFHPSLPSHPTNIKTSAICLSTLHAPSPPEPALIASTSVSQPDEAAIRPPSIKDATVTDTTITAPSAPEQILKLRVCGHEFHAECLVSWVVLRKTTCPICRATYISKEEMQQLDEEAAIGTTPTTIEPMPVVETPAAPPVSNWRYFWRGGSAWYGDNMNQTVGGGRVGARVEREPSRFNSGLNGRMAWPRR